MSVVYIAMPHAGATPEETARNFARAVLLGKLAQAQGHTPIVPHVLCTALFGANPTPEMREKALAYRLALVEHVRGMNGHIWYTLQDDGTLSAGVHAECERGVSWGFGGVLEMQKHHSPVWCQLESFFVTYPDLYAEWCALSPGEMPAERVSALRKCVHALGIDMRVPENYWIWHGTRASQIWAAFFLQPGMPVCLSNDWQKWGVFTAFTFDWEDQTPTFAARISFENEEGVYPLDHVCRSRISAMCQRHALALAEAQASEPSAANTPETAP